jgi:fumarylacetoacetase
MAASGVFCFKMCNDFRESNPYSIGKNERNTAEMNLNLNETHDPKYKSWVDSANRPGSDFPLQNLPFGIYRRLGSVDTPRLCVAIGDYALDVPSCDRSGLFRGLSPALSQACMASSLNELMSLQRPQWSALRRELHRVLRVGGIADANAHGTAEAHIIPLAEIELLLPSQIGNYTDFYASIYHATNVGRMFRPDHPLTPSYKSMPIGYHGRASSIVPSGTPVRRPMGQAKSGANEAAILGTTRQLDYELEIGFFVGTGNELGQPIGLDRAEDHIFGFCILNDWSARDVQAWESQPLGPFLSKNFATTISPWIVTLEALAPFRVSGFPRAAGDPEPLSYLCSKHDRELGGVDMHVEVLLSSTKMRAESLEPIRLSRGNLRDLYWTPAQMLTHHTSNGCNLRPGDLLATGTVSGNSEDSRACLLELTNRGARSFQLPTGESRAFLEDGDEVIMSARCESPNAVSIGFGLCRGTVLPARK